MQRGDLNLPNILSGFRLVAAPVLVALAWAGEERAFIVLILVAFLSDALDGMLARHLNQVTELGARLDSWGDLAIYLTLVVSAFLLWNDQLMEQALFTLPVIASILLVPLVALTRFGSLTSYHTWLTKAAAVAIAAGGTIFLSGGPAWTFQLACVLVVIAALEQIIISLTLREKRSDVKSLWHVLTEGERQTR